MMLNLTQKNGIVLCLFSVRQRHVEVVRLLIDKGADIKAVDHNRQRTLLMRAARSGSIPTIELLLERGVDFHATDKFGRNVLQFTKEKQVFDFLYAVDHQNRLIPGCYKDAQASMRDCPRCEILASDLEMGRGLGHGGCGVVRLAKWCGTQVAVKEMMHHNMDGDTAFQEFYAEAELMKELRHTNVIQFLGVVSEASHFKIVTEYGDLLKVLRRKEHQLTDKQLIWLAVGIARGMMYLHGLRHGW
ncbi:hypothetical protein CEUSTIGMA_g10910.t1 [Chlamydomonas eustigma]|uniref:Protein kinase domain-containing protein n=1 Tax=Chlamydomonas eustigma TaxID=1157962 RepID=A0A250XK72_9CHLO|nr:hypothetical protein CEUSTIGMA_g10910.t1 [Chlamydomonas eustigma]|eukprot:GAX83485.1 hypothetical protein CEUSTIGMA_g10910.t1 [Chlamydomonas eustigma]